MRFTAPLCLTLAALLTLGCEPAADVDTPDPAADTATPDGSPPPTAEDAPGDAPQDDLSSAAESYPFDFQLTSVEGETISKADFAGKVLVVDIWGTWCPPCRKEVPHFVELQTELADQGLQIVGINYEGTDSDNEAIDAINAFTEEMPINYPLLLGTQEVQAQVPGFRVYPTTLFIDRQGKVRRTEVGYHPKEDLKKYMEELLNEQA